MPPWTQAGESVTARISSKPTVRPQGPWLRKEEEGEENKCVEQLKAEKDRKKKE